MSKSFKDFCDTKIIKRELSVSYTSPLNDVTKHLNRTIQERVKSMLSNVEMSNEFWAKVVATSTHLVNRSLNKKLDLKVVEELWTGKPCSCKHLRVFGREAYCHISKEFRDKLAPKSKNCIVLGYGEPGEMGFRLWDQEVKKIGHSHNVFFNAYETC